MRKKGKERIWPPTRCRWHLNDGSLQPRWFQARCFIFEVAITERHFFLLRSFSFSLSLLIIPGNSGTDNRYGRNMSKAFALQNLRLLDPLDFLAISRWIVYGVPVENSGSRYVV